MIRSVLSLAIALGGCVSRTFPLLPDGGDGGTEQDAAPPDSGDAPFGASITVCLSGCDFTAIQSAVDYATGLTDTDGEAILIEVRDSRTYRESITIGPLSAGVPLELRARAMDHPTILSDSLEANVLTIGTTDVTIAGFTFRGSVQRAIWVNAARATIHHNAFSSDFNVWNADQYYRGVGVLLQGEGTRDAELTNNTFYDCEEALQIIDAPQPGNAIGLRNNIFVQISANRPECEPLLWIKPSLAHYALSSDYNLFHVTGGECLAWVEQALSAQQWGALGMDEHSVAGDPLLADAAGYDYHLRSATGRFDPASGSFVPDADHSPAIDRGDPSFSVGVEPAPNGGRIDLGNFGGTAEASMSEL